MLLVVSMSWNVRLIEGCIELISQDMTNASSDNHWSRIRLHVVGRWFSLVRYPYILLDQTDYKCPWPSQKILPFSFSWLIWRDVLCLGSPTRVNPFPRTPVEVVVSSDISNYQGRKQKTQNPRNKGRQQQQFRQTQNRGTASVGVFKIRWKVVDNSE